LRKINVRARTIGPAAAGPAGPVGTALYLIVYVKIHPPWRLFLI